MLQPCALRGVYQGAHSSWRDPAGVSQPFLSTLSAPGAGATLHPGIPPGLSSEEVDWNYLVQWLFTRASQLKFICHCSLVSQGAPGSANRCRKEIRFSSEPSLPLRQHNGQKPSLVAAEILGRRREMACQGGQLSGGMCDRETSVG